MSRTCGGLRLLGDRAVERGITHVEDPMKYLLMMNAPRGTGDWAIFGWPANALEAHVAFMNRLNRELAARGELVSCEALTPPGQARLVRARQDGTPDTDGPFAESKEFLAGFWIVEVDRPERAYEIAAEVSLAPGPDGEPLHMEVEVRQVMSGPPPADL